MEEQHHHGNSIAAWTAVGIILAAFTVMSVAVVVASVALFVVGCVVVVIGVIAGKVLAMAGYGVDGRRVPAEQHDA